MNKIKFSTNISLDKNFLKGLLVNQFKPGFPVVVKLHFGEPGNPHAFKPSDVEPLVRALQELNFEVILTDTPVAYDSPRGSKQGYEKLVEKQGYSKLTNCYIEDQYLKQRVGDLEFEVAKILAEAKNVLVLSHVKGHECAGFGGAIKNLGMGALSAKSKNLIHNASKPVLNPELCVGCAVCANACPASAITIQDGLAEANLNLCYGCSICQIVCPQGALRPKIKTFDEGLAMGAVAAIKLMPKNTFYINVIKNIAKGCDCEGREMPILANDIGILYGDNPVAIDQASVDLINEKETKDVFYEANNKDPKLQIDYVAQYADLSKKYQLEN
jgi:uncharacterized Fe-S center protein